ncbi:MAG: hypothetical protein AVW06_03490 [Hadesarchaea archaeon DG-33-1]|nr:MAG: hypothetical protein AVW06_03490 [Hadesarchaea archaeon DG-33-1]
MKKLRKVGLSYEKIADELKLSPMTVYNYLKKKEKIGFFERLKGKIAIMLIAVVVLGFACVDYYLVTREEEYETYINEDYSFKFDYPTDWIFEELGTQWVAYFGAVENTPEDELGGIITLAVYDRAIFENQFGVSLDNLADYVLSSLENIENFVWISKPTEIVIDNVSAIRYSVALTRENITLQFQSELVVKDNYLYEFTTGTEEEKYSDYRPVFEHVIDSFSLKVLS